MSILETWTALRLGQNAIDTMLEEEWRLARQYWTTVKKRKALESEVNLAFDIAMKIEHRR